MAILDPLDVPLSVFGPADFYEMLDEARRNLPEADPWRLDLEREAEAGDARVAGLG